MTLSLFLQPNLWDRIVTWYRSSLLRELFVHFSEDVYGVQFDGYENIRLTQNAEANARSLILALMAAILVAGAAIVWTRTVPGGLVRRLLRAGATDPDHALTLDEAGYFRSFGIRRDLAIGGALTKVVKRAGDPYVPSETKEEREGIVARLNRSSRRSGTPVTVAEQTPVPEAAAESPDPGANGKTAKPRKKPAAPTPLAPVNFLTDRFYIPEDLIYRAEIRYEKKGSGVRAYLLLVAVTLAVGALLCRFLPALFSFADFLISAI